VFINNHLVIDKTGMKGTLVNLNHIYQADIEQRLFLSNEKPTTLITKNQPPQQFEC